MYPKIKDQFKARAGSFDISAKWVTDRDLLEAHSRIAGVSKGDLVLEVCCGTGIVGQRLLRDSAKVVGIDISRSMLNKASARLSFCVNAQAESLPFLDDVFDLAVCRQAFHFLDTKQVLAEMARVVKKGTGKVVISQIVPFGEEDSDWLQQIHHKKQPLLKNFLRKQDLLSLARQAGFSDIVCFECQVEEDINKWLEDTYFSQEKIEEIKKMFSDAPDAYKQLHKTKVMGGNIYDTMRWVIIRGRKND